MAARRGQIVRTAIEAIADVGLAGASLADIAERAGISKGVISYHFHGKDELLAEVLRTLLRESGDYVAGRVDARQTATAKLEEYVRASLDHLRHHRERYVTWFDLWGSFSSRDAKQRFDARIYDACRRSVERILRLGRRRGEFRAIPPGTAAALIQGAIDGLMLQWVLDPEAVDLGRSADGLVEMVLRYARRAL
jgi:AcrR family transcriptional regulator